MTTSSRARLSQERSRRRREALLDAAIALFAEGGARAVTHRAVAARAGMPSATTTYYFESIEELLSEALSRHIETWLAELRELTTVGAGPVVRVDTIRPLIEAAFAARSPETVRLQLAVYLAAAADPRLKGKAAEAIGAVERLAGRLLAAAGVAQAEGLAEAMVRLIAGSAVVRLSGEHDDRAEAEIVYESLRRLLAAWTLDEEAIATALRR